MSAMLCPSCNVYVEEPDEGFEFRAWLFRTRPWMLCECWDHPYAESVEEVLVAFRDHLGVSAVYPRVLHVSSLHGI